ncbi:MAG: fumarylacetoacetate hydrolase family protein [Lachnospiraceae bacterium]|nr:fumarylacetoacetate hydrolase family protein [Lachnospiraceae bacterium]
MKLITCKYKEKEVTGVLLEESSSVQILPFEDMNALIQAAAQSSGESLRTAQKESVMVVPLSEVSLLAPIPRPRQDVICLGINYKKHAEEAERYSEKAFKKERPIPIYFSKRVTEAVAPEGTIESHPGLVQRLDYECELAVIIGKTARNVKAEEAEQYIFGYTVLNDVSARLLQTSHKQWYFGKGLDGFTPMGPCITTADEIPWPPALGISSRVNGELRQNSTTDLLITSIPEIIEELSSGMTLLPGTIIATGTPAGVGMGFDPPKFLKPGDVVECTIEGIGTICNTVR